MPAMHDRALETLIDPTRYLGLIPRDGTGQRPQNARPLIGGSLSEHQCNLCHDPTDREGTCINCLREKLKYTAECARCYVKLLGDSFHMRWKKRGKFVDGFVCNRCRGIIADSVTGEDYETFQARRVTQLEPTRDSRVSWHGMGQSIREERKRMQIETGTQRVFFPYKSDPFIAVGKIRTLEATKDTRQDHTGKTVTTNVFAVTIEVQHKVGEETVTVPIYIKDARLYEAITESVKKGKCPFGLVLDDKRNVKGYTPKEGQRFACVVSGRETDDNGKVKFTSKLFFVMGDKELLILPTHVSLLY